MNKIFLGGFALILCSGVAWAQEEDLLFPELMGQFEQPTQQPSQEKDKPDTNVKHKKKKAKPDFNAEIQDPDSNIPTNRRDEKTDTGEKAEGNLVIQIQNVDGVLPYARTLAYCTAEALFTNETNQRLHQLSVKITYKDMPTDLNYSSVSPKKQRVQKFMLIGLPCESIKGMPDFEVTACKLGKQSESDCKKRVQLVPPGG